MDEDEFIIWLVGLVQSNNLKAFYNSKPWREKRIEILKEQNHECQRCKQRGLYTKAITVHHTKYLKKHPELALVTSNLESICEDCHYKEHHRAEYKAQLNVEKW